MIIFSDDPDATEKLVDKIERLKKRQGVMKRANHLIRKADREGLADLGFSEETIAKLFAQDFAGRAGFPNYALANNSANIRRLEKRLAAIQNAQHDETTEDARKKTEYSWNTIRQRTFVHREKLWARLLGPPSDEREIVRYCTLSREDLDIIFRKRSDHSRLGFALLLCYLRYPGRVLGAEEVPPVALVSFVARQLGVSPSAFIRYSRRDQTRREQLAELMERLSYRSFDRASFLHYLAWLTPIAQNVQRPGSPG